MSNPSQLAVEMILRVEESIREAVAVKFAGEPGLVLLQKTAVARFWSWSPKIPLR